MNPEGDYIVSLLNHRLACCKDALAFENKEIGRHEERIVEHTRQKREIAAEIAALEAHIAKIVMPDKAAPMPSAINDAFRGHFRVV